MKRLVFILGAYIIEPVITIDGGSNYGRNK